MTLIELGPPAAEPLTLVDAKAWCRIERGDEDTLVETLIRAAREAIERETRLVLARRSFRLVLDGVPAGSLALPRGPRPVIVALTAYDADGAPQPFNPESAVPDGAGAVRLADAVRLAAVNGVEIDFEAGFALGELPESLRLAMRQTVCACYELRAAVPGALQPAVFPVTARALVAPHRELRL